MAAYDTPPSDAVSDQGGLVDVLAGVVTQLGTAYINRANTPPPPGRVQYPTRAGAQQGAYYGAPATLQGQMAEILMSPVLWVGVAVLGVVLVVLKLRR
jgi:hypothetical protein